MNASERLGVVALLAGGACIALTPIGVRLTDVSPAASAFWRVLLAVPMLATFALVRNNAPTERTPDAPRAGIPILLAGIAFAGDLGFWHAALSYTSVANATLEANFAPIFVAIGAWILFRERPKALFAMALAVTLAGAVLLVGPNWGAPGAALFGDLLGVITAMFYAAYMLAVKAASPHTSTMRIALGNTIVAAVILAPYAWFAALDFWPQSLRGWAWLIVLALIGHTLGQSLIAYGFARVRASLGSVVLLVQPVLAAVYAWVLLGETMNALQMLGAAIVLAGIYMARRAG